MQKINWWEPDFSKIDTVMLKDVLSSNFINEGPITKKLENKISKILGCKYCSLTTSGTTAIFLAIKSLGIGLNDEILLPNFTFIATANAIKLSGAKPIFIDCDPETLCIDPKKIEEKISPNTKAIIPVHISGRASDMLKIKKISKKYDLKIIEDSAEAFMSKNNGKYLGTLGNVGCFSLSPNKIISTGQGGIVVTNNSKIYKAIKRLKDQGRLERGTGGNDIHKFEGYNFKFNDILATIGLRQLKEINLRLKKQIMNYKFYKKNINSPFIKLYDFDVDSHEVPLWFDAIYTSKKNKKFFSYLKKNHIPIRKFWYPITSQKVFLENKDYKNTINISKNGFWLPSSFNLSKTQLKHICNIINQYEE